MYSRNFGTFENVSSVKLNSELRNRATLRENTVPVKNFSDSSAYERFNSLGSRKSANMSSDSDVIQLAENIASEENNEKPEENVIPESTAETLSEENGDDIKAVSAPVSDSKNEKSVFSMLGDIHKFTDIIDGDFLLIALAAAMIFFGNNETNDKLTPIALLAIMFL